jgi:hypothetical protein
MLPATIHCDLHLRSCSSSFSCLSTLAPRSRCHRRRPLIPCASIADVVDAFPLFPVVQLEQVQVVQIKTKAKDGVDALQIGAANATEKNYIKPELGHFKAAGVQPKQALSQFRVTPDAVLPVGTLVARCLDSVAQSRPSSSLSTFLEVAHAHTLPFPLPLCLPFLSLSLAHSLAHSLSLSLSLAHSLSLARARCHTLAHLLTRALCDAAGTTITAAHFVPGQYIAVTGVRCVTAPHVLCCAALHCRMPPLDHLRPCLPSWSVCR